jgi:hypothetical protein
MLKFNEIYIEFIIGYLLESSQAGVNDVIFVVRRPRFGQKKNSLLVSNPGESPSAKHDKKADVSVAKKSKEKEEDEKESLFDGSQAGSMTLTSKQETMSSSDLLTRMQRRHQLSTPATTSSTSADADDPDDPDAVDAGCHASDKDRELLTDIRDFIAFMSDVNGQASTQELLTNFGPRLPPNESAKFKAMLLQICDLQKVSGVARWVLKAEFR